MKLIVGNSWATLIGYDSRLKKVCSYMLPGAKYTKAFIERGWDGRLSLIRSGRIPSGLVQDVVKAIPEVVVVDKRQKPLGAKPLHWYGPSLREYQNIHLTKPQGIIAFPCGSGKTLIEAKIIADLNLPSLIVVPSRDLVTQTRVVFEECLQKEIGELTGKCENIQKFTVTTIQKLNSIKNLGKLAEVDVLLVDEIHHTVGLDKWFWRLLEVGAYWRIGFTATPYRTRKTENVLLKAITSKIMAQMNIGELSKKGYLVPVELKFLSVNSNEIQYKGNWGELYEEGIVLNEYRNETIIQCSQKYYLKNRNVLILVERIAHGKELSRRSGFPFLYGDISTNEREEVLEQFRSGRIRGLVASRIFSEGIDIPNLNVLIIACGGESDVKSIQRMGRALRPYPGKEKAIVVDFMDNQNFLLKKHSISRFKAYKKVLEIEDSTDISKIGGK